MLRVCRGQGAQREALPVQQSAEVTEVGRSRRWGVRSLAKQGQAPPVTHQNRRVLLLCKCGRCR